MKKFLHMIFGCSMTTVGHSVMGAPILYCETCDRYVVVYGYGSYEHPISREEANQISDNQIYGY